MTSPPLVGVILSAGGSTRMGEPKGLLRLADGRTLIAAHRDALARVCERIVVVTGAHTPALSAALGAATTCLHASDWETTDMLASLALALHHTAASRVLVTPVDAPPAPPASLDALAVSPAPAVLAWQGQPGHPVLLGPEGCDRIRRGPVVGGLRTLLGLASLVPGESDAVLLNLNTPQAWRAWLARQDG